MVLYFIKIGCPVNQRAIPYFNKIADAYKGKATLVGVINGDMAAAKQWKEDNGASYTILADSDNSTIRAYKAMYSPWAVTIKQDGKIAKSLPGGSKDELTVINDFMAAAAKTAPSKIAFDGAPRGGG